MKKYRFLVTFFIIFSIVSVYYFFPKEKDLIRNSDEGYYLSFIKAISEKGISQFPVLIKEYATNAEAHLFPPPSRVGYIFPAALWVKVFGFSFVNLVRFSLFCYILFLLVCFYFSRKIFGDDICYPFMLILSSAPLTMAMAKTALSESMTNLFWALSIWTFLDFLKTKKLAKLILFLGSYSLCIMVKDSSLVLLVFFVASFLLYKYYFKNLLKESYLLSIIFIPPIIVGILYFFLVGGLKNLVALITGFSDAHLGATVRQSYYAVLFCSGPWFRFILDFLLISPINTILFIAFAGHILTSDKPEYNRIYFVIYFFVVLTVFSLLEHSKVVRAVINLEMVMSLCSAFMLYELSEKYTGKVRYRLIFLTAVALYVINYADFLKLFCETKIYDPISFWLLITRKIIPFYRVS